MNPIDAWNAAFNQLEMQLDRASFDTWLRDATLLRCDGDVFVVGVRNNYARDMLQHRLYRNVRRVLSDVYGRPTELKFEIARPPAKADADDDMPLFRLMAQQAETTPPAPLHQQVARPQRPDPPECELNPRYTFERFIVGNENPMLYPAARAVAERPGMAYNPLLIYGGVGLGKTHLLQAVAHVCRDKHLRVIYISSEAFTNDLIDAIRHKTTAMFREKYRTVDVLLVDDIQFIAGKDSTQEEFFHTFNTLHMYGKQIVMVSDRHPSQMEGVADRLRSRFQSGLMVDVQAPGLETRLAIVKMWAQERDLTVPPAVCEMLASRACSNIRELESMFNQVAASAQLSRRPITLDAAQAVLDGYRRPRNQVTVAQVLDVTARHHGLSIEDLTGPRRNSKVTQARQIAMYVARDMTSASLLQIGEVFGGRKHSTVLHNCNKVAKALDGDELLRATIRAIREQLETSS